MASTLTTMPDPEDACGGCQHPFTTHWINHDGERQGCLEMVLGAGKPKGNETPCDCHGFLIAWHPKRTIVLDLPQGPPEPSYPLSGPDSWPDYPPSPGEVIASQPSGGPPPESQPSRLGTQWERV